MLSKSGGDYMLGDQLTIVDFYVMAFVIVPQELGIVTIEKYNKLQQWYKRIGKIETAKKAINCFNKKIAKETKPAKESTSIFKFFLCGCFSSSSKE